MKITTDNVNVGHGVIKGFNGDVYPYYIVGIERGNYKYNRGEVIGLYVVKADSKCNDYFASDWSVEEFNPNIHNMGNPNVFHLKRTRKNHERFSEDGKSYGVWDYRLCEKPYKAENPMF